MWNIVQLGGLQTTTLQVQRLVGITDNLQRTKIKFKLMACLVMSTDQINECVHTLHTLHSPYSTLVPSKVLP